MTRKLLKYEFMATGRLYLPLYLVMLGFAALGRLSVWRVPWQLTDGVDAVGLPSYQVTVNGEGLLRQLLGFLVTMILVIYVLVVLGAFVVHFIITLQRFWKNLMGDEGYLMFTLPVSAGELLWSKAICSFLWSVATGVMVILSVLLLLWHPRLVLLVKEELSALGPESWNLIGQMLRASLPPALRLVLAVEVVVNGISGLFLLYAAMAIGHTVQNHKALAAVGAYAAIITVVGTAASLVMGAVAPFLTGNLRELQLFSSTPELLLFAHSMGDFLLMVLCIALAIDLLTAVGGFFLARYLLTTQLNLE